MKIYLKRGAPNYKEKRLITAIEKAYAEKLSKDSSFTFQPAKTYEELKKMHDDLAVTDVEFEETGTGGTEEKTNDIAEQHKEFVKGVTESVESNDSEKGSSVSPFNEANPIVRDYVADNGFKENEAEGEKKTTFEEPTDFKSSFEMPSSEDEKGSSKNTIKEPKREVKKDAPINPKFDEMSDAKKKRSTKKFAKLIIEGACILAEKGCIWWTTKDITEAKLAEYQLEDTMDLGILLTLEDNQRQPVIEWFRARSRDANEMFKVGKEDKEDLIDSLYEVMLEKKIAPTPMQELMINVGKVFLLDMGVKAFQLSQQINDVLGQLKGMKVAEKQAGDGNSTTTSNNNSQANDDNVDDTNTDVNPATSNQLAITEQNG